jgi:hypothetical protein
LPVNKHQYFIDKKPFKRLHFTIKWGFATCQCYSAILLLPYKQIQKLMKAHFKITSNEIGTVLLRRRKIAKALRWWLRQNGFAYEHKFFCS